MALMETLLLKCFFFLSFLFVYMYVLVFRQCVLDPSSLCLAPSYSLLKAKGHPVHAYLHQKTTSATVLL